MQAQTRRHSQTDQVHPAGYGTTYGHSSAGHNSGGYPGRARAANAATSGGQSGASATASGGRTSGGRTSSGRTSSGRTSSGRTSSGRTSSGRTGRKGRRRDPLWARLTIVFGSVLMMLSGVGIAGGKVLLDRYTGAVEQENLIGGAIDTGDKGLEGSLNFLLLGVDTRARDPNNTRSDSIMIAHVPASHDQAYLMSVPRDTWVDVPAYPKTKFRGGHHKLTEAFYFGSINGGGRAGGSELVALTIKRLTGITFDGAAIIDFNGFKRVIDAIGGVEICVDHEVTSAHMRMVNGKPMWLADARKLGGGKPVVHKVGCQHMPGWAALDYSRQRYGLPGGDYDRQRHQQQVVKAMIKGMMSTGVVTNPVKLDKVIRAAGKALTVDTGGASLADFVLTLKGVAANDLIMLRTNGGKFNSEKVNGQSVEVLSEESRQMFAAAKNGQLAEFVLAYPDWVSKAG